MHRLVVAIVLSLLSLVFLRLVMSYGEQQTLRSLASYYVTHAPVDFGVPNVVTGILVAWRGFDTLGEVAVLFMVAASMSMLSGSGHGVGASYSPGEIVQVGAQILLPLMLTFGAYVIVNGHLSAGGGFQGGAIVASGTMLAMLARPHAALDMDAFGVVESIAGVLYVLVGVLGLVLAGGFLDPRFLPRGEFGALFSAGAIPLISVLLGVKVGAELSVIIDRFRAA
ncbi:MAG TPA: hydrogen gas-evolving membrane-bound hydrogenase subunit E [Paraburkholderia sp.]|jgi:multicomponent Na+:H+ antiporter subunit B